MPNAAAGEVVSNVPFQQKGTFSFQRWQTADAGKDGRQKEKWVEDEMDVITDSVNMNLSKFWEIVKDRGAWCTAVYGVAESDTTW